MAQYLAPTSRKDRAEVAAIQRMLSEHHAWSCAECILIGQQIYRHLERKQLLRGEVQRYAKSIFNHDAEYLRRFVRLYIYEDDLPEVRAWQIATGWNNLYAHEPQRSNNLLT